uniref:30S ribosomal protein S16 n=1 Tax=Nephromyces sp. ex Molgula occidentalis TaxID=2544991 RepID=A0A5C1H7V0_9APIC|nr:hypothetical protein [Nephromyces sp. ex Molgula occidentalis]
MIFIAKLKTSSQTKRLLLYPYNKKKKRNYVGFYNSQLNWLYYSSYYILTSLKTGNKISKALIRLIIKNLKKL